MDATDLPELSSLFQLGGRVALVTGAGRGIGAAVARYLGAAGAEVVLVARTPSELRAVAGQIESAGGRAQVRACDVTDSSAVRALVDGLPRLDIVVNNAGNNFPEPMVDVSDEHLDALIALNTRAVFVVAQAAVRKMLEDPERGERGGAVINMSSQMGHIGSPNRTVYCMTKHAVEGLTKAMAVELAPQGIRVNSIGLDLRRHAAGAPHRRHAGEVEVRAVEHPARAPGQGVRHRGRRGLPRVARRRNGDRHLPARRRRLDSAVTQSGDTQRPSSGPGAALPLDGRTALVTGAGSGTGRAIALALAAAGARVVLVGRTPSSLAETAAGISDAAPAPLVSPCDVTDAAAVRALIGALDRLDVVVNNAGSNIPRRFVDVDDGDLDALIGLNLRAVYVVAQAAVRRMLALAGRRGRHAVIINVSSQMGHVGSPDRSVYCMTKHGVEGLTKAMAVEFAPLGIRINSLAPTFVDTPLIRRIVDTHEKRSTLLSRIPMGRMASEREIAQAALYLASDAAAMVTGTSLLVDGGWTAQ